jgi:amidase
MLEGLGHDVAPGFPAVMGDSSFTPRFMAIWGANMAIGIAAYGAALGRDLTEDEVEVVNWAQAEFAEHVTSVEYAKGLAATAEYRREIQGWWTQGWDLLLTPTLGEPPPRVGEHRPQPDDPMAGMKRAADWVAFTPPFNVSGQPAINVPLHWNEAGLPVGIQLAAAYGREDLLIQVASQLESAHPWAHLTPG